MTMIIDFLFGCWTDDQVSWRCIVCDWWRRHRWSRPLKFTVHLYLNSKRKMHHVVYNRDAQQTKHHTGLFASVCFCPTRKKESIMYAEIKFPFLHTWYTQRTLWCWPLQSDLFPTSRLKLTILSPAYLLHDQYQHTARPLKHNLIT